MSHVVAPVTHVPLFVLLVELLTRAMPHVLLPVADVEAIVVEEADAVLTLADTVSPGAVVLVPTLFLSVAAYENSRAITLLADV